MWQAYAGIAALQLAGGYFASQNIREGAQLNKEIADMNAQFAEVDAYNAITQGETNKAKYQKVVDSTLADQQLALTASKIDPTYGTAASFQEETKFISELNMMEIEKEAREIALGIRKQARDIRMTGKMQQYEANSKASSVMFESVVGAAKTGLSSYQSYQAENPPKGSTGYKG